MSRLCFRVGLIVSVTLAVSAVMVRLAWEVTLATAVGTMVIVALLMLVALSLYLTIKSSWKKVGSPPVRIWFTVIITVALISGIIHFVRFVPSPEAFYPLSKIIASLFLAAGISAYLLALGFIWKART